MLMGCGKESIIKKYNVSTGDYNIMNETASTMNKLYKLRSSIRKFYLSADTSSLTESIYKSIRKNYCTSVESCLVNISNYSISVQCKPCTATATKNEIIKTVIRKLKNFIMDNSEIVQLLDEDPKLIKATLDSSDSFVCDVYIIGDTISFLL